MSLDFTASVRVNRRLEYVLRSLPLWPCSEQMVVAVSHERADMADRGVAALTVQRLSARALNVVDSRPSGAIPVEGVSR